MDEADITGERAEYDHQINLQISRKPEGPQPTGYCLFCAEPVEHPRRWCSSDCREDWELHGE